MGGGHGWGTNATPRVATPAPTAASGGTLLYRTPHPPPAGGKVLRGQPQSTRMGHALVPGAVYNVGVPDMNPAQGRGVGTWVRGGPPNRPSLNTVPLVGVPVAMVGPTPGASLPTTALTPQ
jgi:hypothetical protein